MKMSKRAEIAKYVKNKILYLSEVSEHISGTELAKLRRGVDHLPGEIPAVYSLFLRDMPENFWNENGTVSKAEIACYLTLTLYAVHQQGNSPKIHNMHSTSGNRLGQALRKLASAQGDANAEERALKKLQMLVTAKDVPEFSHHLRGIIVLLRDKGITLDYSDLAKDIYDFQFDESRTIIGLKWGQDFFRKGKDNKDENR